MSEPNAPAGDDTRHDDLEFNPQLEPKKAKAWINLLEESEKAFEDWNDRCDNIDKLYANLERLANSARDKEFQMFWANQEVIKPSIYARPPQPVVVPKFKDRRPVIQAASEFLERCATVSFDLAHIDDLMRLIRDDVVMTGRGVPWCRYESGGDGYYDMEKVCIDFKNRRDFLHSLSRNWSEVTWVAGASYLTRAEARKRFRKYSGNEYQDAEYRVDKDSKEIGGADNRQRAKFWEIWDKVNKRVVWVAKGCENILDEDDPHLDLLDCFPCPRPAYGTLQRGSLVPVPDVLQYKDQLDEINLLTARIHALSDALEAKGFYPAGGAELGDAIQTAIRTKTPGRLLVPISNWAAFGGSKEVIIWLPIDMIAQTITQLVQLRKQVIEDIYQITGLSDIMRGSTDPRETLGSQQLKTQFGSTRIRDRQGEMVRVARDLVGIACDIITEKFDPVTMIEMSQTQLPTMAMQRQQVQALQQQISNQQRALQMAQQLPQAQQMMQQQPEQAQQLMQQAQQMIQEGQKAVERIMAKPTIEQVLHFLKDNRARAFVLDIETDSTILVDENAEKQRRAEFTAVLAQLLPQLAQLVMADPATGEFCGEVLKFSVAPYRAGRSLDGSIDQMVELMKQRADQPQQREDPTVAATKSAEKIEQMKLDHAREKDKQEFAMKNRELDQKARFEQEKIESNERMERMKLFASRDDDEAKAQLANLKAIHEREKHQRDMIKMDADLVFQRQKGQLQQEQAIMRQGDMAARADERRAAQQFKQQQAAQRGFPGGAQ